MTVVAVIQARMSSTRLPGKVLEGLGGSSILGWVVAAAQEARLVDRVVVATSREPADDVIADAARVLGAQVVRGPLDDVLARYVAALDEFPADVVVRLTADCPLLDPRIIDQCAGLLDADPSIDLATNVLVRTHPRGLDVEAVRVESLRASARVATGHHRAHVTSWIMGHPEDFSIAGVVGSQDAADLRVTVDTAADLGVVRAVVAALGARARRVEELVAFLRQHPGIAQANAHVEQKPQESG